MPSTKLLLFQPDGLMLLLVTSYKQRPKKHYVIFPRSHFSHRTEPFWAKLARLLMWEVLLSTWLTAASEAKPSSIPFQSSYTSTGCLNLPRLPCPLDFFYCIYLFTYFLRLPALRQQRLSLQPRVGWPRTQDTPPTNLKLTTIHLPRATTPGIVLLFWTSKANFQNEKHLTRRVLSCNKFWLDQSGSSVADNTQEALGSE